MAGDVDRAARIAAGLVSDGFAAWDSAVLTLTSGAVTSVTAGLSPGGAWVT
jgi:hypothetical protein